MNAHSQLQDASLRKAPSLTLKNQTRLERPARDKPFSFLLTFINYGRKKFYNIGPRVKSLRGS
jgi:hypothetical protein